VSGASNAVTANAADNIGVAGVQFYLDYAGDPASNKLGAEDILGPPYSTNLDTTTLSNGSHTLTAIARDAAGNTTLASTVTITVSNVTPPPPDTTPPSVPTGLNSTAKTTTSISLAWNASSDNVGGTGLAGYKIYRSVSGGAYSFLTSTNQLIYTDSGLTPGTNYAYKISAYDNAGTPNESAQSTALSVTTDPPPDTTAPTVNLTAPANGATVSTSSVTVSANAADNVGVAGVQFKLDGANLGSEDTTNPYSVSWNSTLSTNGSHSLTAVARDAAGNTTTATTITVTVNNVTPPPPDTTAPTVSISSPSNGSTQSAAISLTATATDNIGVVGVQFKLDGADFGAEDTSSPYSIAWDTTTTANGSHTITAVARDAAGNTKTATNVTITVNNVVTPPPPPPTPTQKGDCNGDGHVNLIDLSILLSHYNSVYSPADFDASGSVTLVDLSIQLSNYGK
jgi:chitodextrinase